MHRVDVLNIPVPNGDRSYFHLEMSVVIGGWRGVEKNFMLNPKKNPTIKYLVKALDGKEVVCSLIPFKNGHTDKYHSIWGGFPSILE